MVGQQARGRGYPSTDSDIAALLAFDHQSHAINLLHAIELGIARRRR